MKRLTFVMISILVFALSLPQVFAATAPTAIKFEKTSVNLSVGRTYTLKTTFTPSTTTNKTLKYTSSNTKVATIDSKGKVTAVASGKSTITAVSAANSKIKATCQVTVLGSANAGNKANNRNARNGAFFQNNNLGTSDLRAEISKISGSTITFKVIKTPTYNRNRNGGEGAPNNGNFQRDPNATPRPRPSFAPGQSPNFQRKVEYTGQQVTVTIKSGVSLTTMSFDKDGFKEKTLAVKDVKVGQTAQLWYKDSKKKDFKRILIIQSFNRANTSGTKN